MRDGLEDEIVNQVSDLGYINGDNDSFIEDPEMSNWDQSKIVKLDGAIGSDFISQPS